MVRKHGSSPDPKFAAPELLAGESSVDAELPMCGQVRTAGSLEHTNGESDIYACN